MNEVKASLHNGAPRSHRLPDFGLLSCSSSPGQAFLFRLLAEPCLTRAPSAGATLFLSLAIASRGGWARLGKGLPLHGLMSDAMGGGGSAGLLLSAGVAEAVSSPVLEVFVRQCDASGARQLCQGAGSNRTPRCRGDRLRPEGSSAAGTAA